MNGQIFPSNKLLKEIYLLKVSYIYGINIGFLTVSHNNTSLKTAER